MLAHSPAPGLLGQAHPDPRRQGLPALAASHDADGRVHADAWRRRRCLRQRWRRHRREEEARERYRKGLIGAFAAGDAEGLLPGAARGTSAGGSGFEPGNIGRGIGERAGDLGGGVRGAAATGEALLGRREIPQDPQTDAMAPPPSPPTETGVGEAPGGVHDTVAADGPGAATGVQPAIRLTGEELVSFDSSFQDLRDAALDWYNENLVDTGFTVTNEHDGPGDPLRARGGTQDEIRRRRHPSVGAGHPRDAAIGAVV